MASNTAQDRKTKTLPLQTHEVPPARLLTGTNRSPG